MPPKIAFVPIAAQSVARLLASVRAARVDARLFVDDAVAPSRVRLANDNAAASAHRRATDANPRLIARWQRNGLDQRLECRWRAARAEDVSEEPPPAACAHRAFTRAAAVRPNRAAPSSRIEIRHDAHRPSPFALPAGRRAGPRARLAQCL
ncbi:hypothetical protein [Lysobacter capsici]|uniref:hypothetical protein n=1 Tax=Lysobacter capsici TaxID=435897 RepID=UPI0012902D5A|nr:hypothetical protein [Lysobacter capsici]